MQREITQPTKLLDDSGRLIQAGYARRPVLTYNPESVRLFKSSALNRLRLKEWDYYGVFIGDYFFSVTISNVGFAGLVFAYVVDFANGSFVEKVVITPFGKGCDMPRASDAGNARFESKGVKMDFELEPGIRHITMSWENFDGEKTLSADLLLKTPEGEDCIVMATPIGEKGFYYNRKNHAIPCEGKVIYGDKIIEADENSYAVLDWGRGVWNYRTFWNWASASGRTTDGRRFGLNMGLGFGDLSAATENCFFINGKIRKLGSVSFDYSDKDFMRPWRFSDDAGRLQLTLIPAIDRKAKSNLLIMASEVHQLFGRYDGFVIDEDGTRIEIKNVRGWAEEHKARW